MEKEFITYDLAVKLRDLGFDEECFASIDKFSNFPYIPSKGGRYKNSNKYGVLACPLWQQAFDWFREKYNLFSTIAISGASDYQIYIHDLSKRNKLYFKQIEEGYFTKIINFCYENQYDIYEKSREALLKQLIKIVENDK